MTKIYENHAQDARYSERDTCPTITCRYGTGGGNVPLVVDEVFNHHMQDGRLPDAKGVSQTITARDGEAGSLPLILMDLGGSSMNVLEDQVGTLRAQTHGHEPIVNTVVDKHRVRKLTPVECERLQGFPDNWTRIPYRGKAEKDCPDSPRYKAIGNSWAVPVVRWIGKRMQKEINGN